MGSPPTIGAYRVEREIGRGGMGVVLLATDSRLGRSVAIKGLPEELAGEPDRLARLEREARALAALHHPNVASIFGIEEHEGRKYLVLEYVEGETLGERLSRGPLALDEALEVCAQIAAGVEAAHEAGVIHRDLKPGNVKLTPDGRVKVLDFGLAKEARPGSAAGSSVEATQTPTATNAAPWTGEGGVLGTPGYLSPEQARGRPLDRRTDVWSLGCILFECLAGRQAFGGETSGDAIAATLRGEPDWSMLPRETPASVREVLRRCLEKDPRRRLRDAGDVGLLLSEGLGAESAEEGRVARAWGWWPLAIAAVIVVVLVQALSGWFSGGSAQKKSGVVRRLTLRLDESVVPPWTFDDPVAISPDGTQVVYVANVDGVPTLVRRRLDGYESEVLVGTEHSRAPFFSPDGRWVGYFSKEGKLKKIPVEGGNPTTLCDAAFPLGGTWGDDGTIIFARRVGEGLFRVPAAGGEVKELTRIDPSAGEAVHARPRLLPGGKALLFTVRNAPDVAQSRVAVLSLETGERKFLIDQATEPVYVETGHIVCAQRGRLVAVPFDLDRLEVTGPPITITEPKMADSEMVPLQYAVSKEGTLVYVPAGYARGVNRALVWVGMDGSETALRAPMRPYQMVRVSPDGRRIVGCFDDMREVWVYDIARGTFLRVSNEGTTNAFPIWAPDGHEVLYVSANASTSAEGMSVFRRDIDSNAPAVRVTQPSFPMAPQSISADGKTLILGALRQDTGRDVGVLSLPEGGAPRMLAATQFDELNGAISPDARWVAYQSNESGQAEVYVQPFPEMDRHWLVSANGGSGPVWAPDARTLYYRHDDAMMAVPIETQPTFTPGTAKELFRGEYEWGAVGRAYDLAPDGKRFLMIRARAQSTGGEEGESAYPREMNVVLNWFEVVRERAAAE